MIASKLEHVGGIEEHRHEQRCRRKHQQKIEYIFLETDREGIRGSTRDKDHNNRSINNQWTPGGGRTIIQRENSNKNKIFFPHRFHRFIMTF